MDNCVKVEIPIRLLSQSSNCMNVNECNDFIRDQLDESRPQHFREPDSEGSEVATSVLRSQPRPAGGWNAQLIEALGFQMAWRYVEFTTSRKSLSVTYISHQKGTTDIVEADFALIYSTCFW